MIVINPKIHDRNSLEFKVGYSGAAQEAYSDFEMSTWIYLPEALDVNAHTYPKENIYRDMLSHMRLITPVYPLPLLAQCEQLPYKRLEQACHDVLAEPTDTARANYEKEIKNYCSIFKSSLRDACRMLSRTDDNIAANNIRAALSDINAILAHYRALRAQLTEGGLKSEWLVFIDYGDEFLMNVSEQHLYRLYNNLKDLRPHIFEQTAADISQLLDRERTYGTAHGYLQPENPSPDANAQFIYHAGQLKKYIESHLYLPTHKRRNAVFLEQVVFSLAAGLSMIFATVISFAFQQTYGNFTLPFFIALVISYMFKDRIKELVRIHFANVLSSRLFEYKTGINVGTLNVGWCKESVDFLNDKKTESKAKAARNRHSPLVIGRGTEEQIILFRKRVHLHPKAVAQLSAYPLQGVNDIIRFNLSELMRKMDNAAVPLCVNHGQGDFETVAGRKIYYINFVFCLKDAHAAVYRRYRVGLSSDGLQSITETQLPTP